jgi:diadenylate cyclase
MKHFFEQIAIFSDKYISWLSLPKIMWTDLVEIIIISFLVYHILAWIKNTKAWSLLKGILVILMFIMIAAIFNMTTILWIVSKVFSVAIMAAVIVFQPELRRALEQLGKRNFFSSLFSFDNMRVAGELFSDRTINEIIKASFEMGKVKTGALIVIEQTDSLMEYERTGIMLDSIVSNQIIINIFEHNTPLHDGAVILRGNRIVSATCYLPLSDNMELSKDLGTRHRAGVGISELTDSLTIIVSEESGKVSLAFGGELYRNIDADFLRGKLQLIQHKVVEEKKFVLWKGRSKDEDETDI